MAEKSKLTESVGINIGADSSTRSAQWLYSKQRENHLQLHNACTVYSILYTVRRWKGIGKKERKETDGKKNIYIYIYIYLDLVVLKTPRPQNMNWSASMTQ